MDAFQQPHRFMRPPPPPMADPHLNPRHLPPPPPRQPVPPQGPWYSAQFQYHHSQPPSPPQWAGPPHSDHLPPPAYPAPPLPPYHAHPPHSQFPHLPRPHLPPSHFSPHHPHSQIPQSYSQVNQEWSSSNWTHHQGWEYPAHNNEEDWAARARAWAAAKAAMENQHPQSQFPPVVRSDEQSHYHDQFPQVVDPHYTDLQQHSLPASSYQQHPAPPAPLLRPPVANLQQALSINSGTSSFFPDGHLPYTARDGTLGGDSNIVFPHQESLPTSPSVHLQEVPSSYSSVAGKEVSGGQNEQLYKSLPLPLSSDQEAQHVQSLLPAHGRSVLAEQSHFAYENQSADPITALADQPLDFAPRFNRDHDPRMQSNYTHPDSAGPVRSMDPVPAMPSIHNWTPNVTLGVVYPSIPPVLASGPQHDSSIAIPSPISGHSAPIFGRIPGPSLHPSVPSVGAAYGLSAGAAIHPTTVFSGDVYGVSSVPERPKKASVPNWLREEIIKKKSVIASSASEHTKEETQSTEDEGADKSLGKGDQADSKSIDSPRSTEQEDDDEDYVEAERTAAINQEIKRVLTEVLLKVTDELFDEIATKVLNEGDLTVEVAAVESGAFALNQNISTPPLSVPTPKVSAKILLPVKSKETETEDVSGKSHSGSPGDVLGLASYASDNDEDEIQSSSMPNSVKNTVQLQSSIKNLSEDLNGVVENSSSQLTAEREPSRGSRHGGENNFGDGVNEFHENRVSRELEHGTAGPGSSSKGFTGDGKFENNVDGKKMLDVADTSKLKDIVVEKVMKKSIPPDEDDNVKKLMINDSLGREARSRSDKNAAYETKRSSSGKEAAKELESGKHADEKGDEIRRRRDERHLRKEKSDNRNGSKERFKEQRVKPAEKAKETDSRKRSSHLDEKEYRKETERDKRDGNKDDIDRNIERGNDEKGDRSRHKLVSESSRHKRRRSSSVSSKGKNSMNNTVVSHAKDSSDDASDDSKRKLHSKRQNLSPSPGRSRRRQVSRSPHSKHSQRRHSPYYSLETIRGKRSRSKSPARRKR